MSRRLRNPPSDVALRLAPLSPIPSLSSLSEVERSEAAKDPDVTACHICCTLQEVQLVVSKECEHRVCKQCISRHIDGSCFSGGAFEIRCPYYCDAMIDWPVLELCASEKQLRWLVTNLVNHAFLDCGEKQYWCPLCDTGFVSDNLDKCPEFQCPNCKKSACDQCHTELLSSTSHECKESEKTGVRVVGTNVIECPGCLAPTVRVEGCNHMTCLCGVHYCWLCGDVITGRVYGHYTEECPGMTGDCVNVLDLEAVEHARRSKKLMWIYFAVFLTGPISIPLLAAGVALTSTFAVLLSKYRNWLDVDSWSGRSMGCRRVCVMIAFLLLPFIQILMLAQSVVACVLILSVLVFVTYVGIPVVACRRRRLAPVLSRVQEYFMEFRVSLSSLIDG